MTSTIESTLPRRRPGAWRRVAAAVIGIVALAASSVGMAAPALGAGTATFVVTKSVDTTSVPIGAGVATFTIGVGQCFNLTGGCDGVILTDQLPAGLEFIGFTNPPAPSVATYEVPSAANGNALTITFTNSLSAGSNTTLSYTARITNDGSVQPGDTLTNTASAIGSNVTPDSDDAASATITATQDPLGGITSTKSWTPTTGISHVDTGKASTITVVAGNTGNRTAESITIVEPSAGNPFDAVDATGASGVLPTGATAIVLTATLEGGGTAIIPTTVSGTSWSATPAPGFDWSTVVGFSAEFTGAMTGSAELAAPAVQPGTLVITVAQRADNRDGGGPLVTSDDPNTGVYENTALTTVTYPAGTPAAVTHSPTANYTVLFPSVSGTVTKAPYSPGTVVRDATTDVTSLITVTNTSVGGAGTLRIDDSPIEASNPYAADELDLNSLDITFPAGAATATIEIQRDGGLPPITEVITGSATAWTGGHDLTTATRFTVTFAASSGTYIANGAAGSVRAHASVNWDTFDATSAAPRGNSAEATISSGISTISAAGWVQQTPATNPLGVSDPVYGITVEKTYGNGILLYYPDAAVPAETTINLDAQVSAGTTPVTRIVVQEPSQAILDGPTANNPMNYMSATSLPAQTVPADTVLTVWYFDYYDPTGGPESDGWKPIPGATFPAGDTADFPLPAAVQDDGAGIRLVYTRTSGVFMPGNSVSGQIGTQLLPDAIGRDDTAFPGATTDENGNRRWELPVNCATAASYGSTSAALGDPSIDADSVQCAELSLLEPTGASWMAKNVHWSDVRKQATSALAANSHTDGRVYLDFEMGIYRPDATSVTIREPGTAAANPWLKAFDLVTVGGTVTRPGVGSSVVTIPALSLGANERATITWLNALGAPVSGAPTTVVTGAPLNVNVATATGTYYPQVAAFELVLDTVDGSPLPSEFFEWTAGRETNIGVVVGAQFQVRAYERTLDAGSDGNYTADGDGVVTNPGGTAPSSAANFLPVRDERSYGYDANANGVVNCTDSFDGSTVPPHSAPAGAADIDCGWLVNDGSGEVTFLPITDTSSPWYNDPQGDTHSAPTSNSAIDRNVHITPALVDIQSTSSVSILAPNGSGNMGVPEDGTPAALFPTATFTGSVSNLSDTAIDRIGLTIGAIPVTDLHKSDIAQLAPNNENQLLSSLRVRSVTLSATGTGYTGFQATLKVAGGADVVLTASTAADLANQINAHASLPTTVGIQIVGLGTAIAPGAKIDVDLALQLRTTLLNSDGSFGDPMINTVPPGEEGSRTAASVTTGSVLDVVANDHADSGASVTLQRGAPGVSARKSFTPTNGLRDLLPETTVELTAGNSGTTPVDSLSIIDLDDADGAGPEASDFYDRFDITSIDSIVAPRSIDPADGVTEIASADTATVTVYTGLGNPVASTPIVLGPVAADGTFDLAPLAGVDLTTVRGIEVVFTNADGHQVGQ